MSDRLLTVSGLSRNFEVTRGLFGRSGRIVRAVDGVSFGIARGEILGLVGESGSGKTTVGRCALRLIEPDYGTVTLAGQKPGVPALEITSLSEKALRAQRHRMQMVFQDPQGFLSPRWTIGRSVAEPLELAGDTADLEARVAALLTDVGLSPGDAARLPHELSGGQKQRVGIARAIALRPELIVADEPVSALDVSVRAQILELISDLREKLGIAWLFIAHDLRAVGAISDRVAVMFRGRIVEIASTHELFSTPRHPYTAALIDALPSMHRTRREPMVESPLIAQRGCAFRPRCAHAVALCDREAPALLELGATRSVSCHRAAELSLPGIVREGAA